MALDRSTITRLRSNYEFLKMAEAKGTASPLELEQMRDRLGKALIKHGDEILRMLEAHS
jgi:hypothetical protein